MLNVKVPLKFLLKSGNYSIELTDDELERLAPNEASYYHKLVRTGKPLCLAGPVNIENVTLGIREAIRQEYLDMSSEAECKARSSIVL